MTSTKPARTLAEQAARGFTLIELMIVVAIISILASIAIPAYVYYKYRSMTAEARNMMSGIRISQEAFLAENDNYANVTTANPAIIPSALKTAWVNTPCPAACDKVNPQNCTEFDCIGFQSDTAVYFRYATPHRISAGTQTAEFGIGAQADLDSDGATGSWGYRSANQGGTLGYVADGVSACSFDIIAYEVVNCTPFQF